MNVVVTTEARFDQAPDGSIWTEGVSHYPFWQRYLDVFDQVSVVARVREVSAAQEEARRADGPGVSFAPVPYYVGPLQYARRIRTIRRALRGAAGPHDAVILRVPSLLAVEVAQELRQGEQPYAVEVVGDPWDVFARGAVRHPLRPVLRRWFARQLRVICSGACAASYVTASRLQSRYPPGENAYTTYYSDVFLDASAFVAQPRAARPLGNPVTVATVGSLEQPYKGVDVLIESVKALCRAALDVILVVVGDGRYRAQLEAQAARFGLRERVTFLGSLPPGEAVRAVLDRADLFVLASRTEGLPRALIEAMARGLPCLGTAVGGIPELLPQEDLVPPHDAISLASKIREVVTNPERMARMSARNLAKAAEYREDLLRERRIAFYRYLREQTEAWIKEQGVQCGSST